MKILALRGRNIASLSDRFEVDLASGMLGDTGLFAIAGPTGAGKSTLLDIICLALFDRTPRLAERGGVSVGRQDDDENLYIKSNDVRGLLSRGAGKGFAEVDFRGRDGQRYRARWVVRRARNKPGGRLQNQEMSLECLDSGRTFGDKKTEVLAAIEDRLGLTFDQFKRSAMLAQGDFAAFLHASDDERANLLERVTGTAIYGDISRASYARFVAERKALEALVTEARVLGRLTPEERDALIESETQAAAALQAAQTAFDAAQQVTAWFTERTKLQQRIEEANSQVAAAERAVADAAPRRQQLDRVTAMLPLRLPLERRDRAREGRAQAREAHDNAVQAHRAAEGALKQAEEAVTTLRAERDAARRKRQEAEPLLARARALDGRLQDATETVRTATSRAEQARSALTAATAERDRLDAVLRKAAKRAEASQQWTAAHPHAERLVAVWPSVQRALATLARTASSLREHEARHPSLVDAASKAKEALETARADELACAASESQASAALHTARKALPTDARTALDARRDALGLLQEQRQQLARAIDQAAESTTRTAELQAEKARLTEQRDTAAAAGEQHREALGQTQAALEQAERTLDRLRAALSAEELRAGLEPGEPCSVCGSTEHPYADGTLLHSLHADAEQDVATHKTAHKQLTEQLATATATLQATEQRLPALGAQLQAEQERLQTASAQWSAARGAHEALPEGVPVDITALAPLDATLQEQSTALAADTRSVTQLEAAVREADATYRLADEARRTAQKVLEAASTAAATASEALAESERAQAQLRREQDAALTSLDDALSARPDWRESAMRDARALEQALAEEVQLSQQHTAVLTTTAKQTAEAMPNRAAAEANRSGAERDQAAREAELATATTQRNTLKTERDTLFEGRSADAVAATLAAAEAAADTKLGTAETTRGTAAEQVSAHAATVKTLASRMSEAAAEATRTQEALDAALAAEGISEETARELLSWSRERVEQETQALEQLDRAVRSATAVLAERTGQLQEHAAHPPEGDEAVHQEALTTRESALKQAREAHADLAAQRRRDDAARTQGEALDQKLAEQQTILDHWKAISDVIGSASGKVFQTFAQGLTLDILLMHANHHLQDLAPRYRLERVPRENLALQVVDTDMGDEVRPIPSLSGGETFLASLSLALGLSSLAASDTPVESLFIDEGFGTLDRDTLEVALAALDALQASGRQVGLISHVDGLAEHIGVAVRIEKLGAGRSRVVLPARDAIVA